MVKSHSEAAHILGLETNPFLGIEPNTGWDLFSALQSIKNRYNKLKSDPDSTLNMNLLFTQSRSGILKKISSLKHGEYLGFSTQWSSISRKEGITGHAYTFFIFKEKNKTHFIYVNRGQRHHTSNKQRYKNTATVFSIDDPEEAKHFAKDLINTVKSFKSRKNMGLLIENHEQKINHPLSHLLRKHNQKTGNCSIANSNISWHFQLASDYMKKHNTNFEVAYNKTKPQYKEMRVRDRVEAFKYLFHDRHYYLTNKTYFYNYIQALNKLNFKDLRDKTNHIDLLVSSFNPKTLSKLIEPLVSKDFNSNLNTYVEAQKAKKRYSWRPALLLSLPIEIQATRERILEQTIHKLPEKKQQQLISKDISLFKYAHQKLQQDMLIRDYKKYFLYANNEVKKEVLEILQKKAGTTPCFFKKQDSSIQQVSSAKSQHFKQ
jgi:hypothetical protein